MRHQRKNKEAEDIIIGRNPVVEAIKKGYEIEKIIIQDTIRGEFEKEIRGLCKELGIPLSKAPTEKLNFITGRKNHQGIVGFISPIKFQKLEDIIAMAFAEGKNPSVMVLEGVSDVRNLAAIARSALVFGFDALVITSKNRARINADAVKASAGAILKIPVCREKNMISIFEILSVNGIKSFATDLAADNFIGASDLTGPSAIVMGSEEKGLSLETKRMSSQLVKIPQASDFDSLNVSVAAGIIMYELNRQRL